MELSKKYIHRNREKGRATSQITLDDDFNVPDSKPDAMRLIQDKGEIKIEECSVSTGHVRITGKLKFHILYRSDSEDRRINSLSGEIPFQESFAVDNAQDYDVAKIKWDMEDLSTSLINSRKLSVRALVQFTATVNEIFDEELITGLMGEGAEMAEAQILEKEHSLLQLLASKKDTFRFKEEIMLPSNKPNIREVLWKNVQLRNVESRLMENQILIKGEALVFVLYLGEEEESRLQWLESPLPFQGMVESGGCNEEQILDLTFEPASIELEPKPDYDGEERMLHMEMVLDLDIRIFQEETVKVLEDLYAIHRRLIPEYEEAEFEKILMKNFSKSRVTDRVILNESQEGILQLCTSDGTVSIDHTEMVEDGILVEGTVNIKLLYVTSDDRMPLSSIKDMIPFHHIIEAPGIKPDCRFQLDAGLEQLTTVMLDSSQVEVKAVVDLNCIVFEKMPVNKMAEVREEALDPEELQERPGIIGYIARTGDRLWDIAKDNFITCENLRLSNNLPDDTIRQGDKLLIIKSIN